MPKTTEYDESTLHMKILQNECKKENYYVHTSMFQPPVCMAHVIAQPPPLSLYAWLILYLISMLLDLIASLLADIQGLVMGWVQMVRMEIRLA